MNTTASFSSEPSWSRRCSTETVFSIQGQETDFVRDTSDTEWCSDEQGVEFEPVTEPEDEGAFIGDSSCPSDPSESPTYRAARLQNEIIATKVVEVSVADDGSLQLADSECSASSSDSEFDLHDYWLCATCRAANNTPLYRYCEKCFRLRKNFFPPRPRPKRKRKPSSEPIDPQPSCSQDSGVETLASQGTEGGPDVEGLASQGTDGGPDVADQEARLKRVRSSKDSDSADTDSISDSDSDDEEKLFATGASKEVSKRVYRTRRLKRKFERSFGKSSQDTITATLRSGNTELDKVNDSDSNRRLAKQSEQQTQVMSKRIKIDYKTDTESESIIDVALLTKTVSDPALTVHTHTKVNICQSSTDNASACQSSTDDTNVVAVKGDTVTDDKNRTDDKCIICTTEPKSGVFVHGRIAHICCCYKCAVEVWRKAKRCPVCNCKVSNVLRAVVM